VLFYSKEARCRDFRYLINDYLSEQHQGNDALVFIGTISFADQQ